MKDNSLLAGVPSFDTGLLSDRAEYTLNQIAGLVRLSHNTIYRAVKSGALKTLDRPGPMKCSGAQIKEYYSPKPSEGPKGVRYMVQVQAVIPVLADHEAQALIRAVDQIPSQPRKAWKAALSAPPVDQFDL
jgi:hypothetical protein